MNILNAKLNLAQRMHFTDGHTEAWEVNLPPLLKHQWHDIFIFPSEKENSKPNLCSRTGPPWKQRHLIAS